MSRGILSKRLLPLLCVMGWVGCSTPDPCNGVTGTCIALRVEGPSGTRVDRLDVATGGATQSSSSKATSLPVQVAVVLPAGTSGDVELDVNGFLAGALVGSGAATIPVTAGKHHAATVTLGGGNNGSTDMAGDTDMGMTEFDLSGGCVPNSTVCSNGSTLQTCSSDGTTLTPTSCPLGCGDTPTPHCKVFVPSAPAAAGDLQTGLADTALTTGVIYLINTDDGSITNIRAAGSGNLSQIVYRSTMPGTNDPGAGIFSFNSLDVQQGATLQAIGGRALVIVANTTIKVTGVIDARAYDKNSAGTKLCNLAGVPGAGGFAGGTAASAAGAGPGGGGGGTTMGSSNGGGGGGGHGNKGGQGGYTVSTDTNYGLAGAIDFPAAPRTLRGGSGGGGGTSTMGNGGGGGGAVQLVAGTSVTVGGGTANGGIDVGGCGGTYGIMYNSGGGGGAGGTIFLESPAINILAMGVLAANGGGGGSYSTIGAAGDLSATAAAGSPGSTSYTTGGNGSAGNITLGSSGGFNSTYNGGGGGGGGAGLILLDNVSGSLTPASGAILSPTLNATNNASPAQVISAVGTITVQ